MSRFKLLALVALITFAFGVTLVGDALAGEKFKLRTVKYSVKWEAIDVGDEEGHAVAIQEAKGIVSNREGKPFGEGWLHRYVATLDMNYKTEFGLGHWYEEVTDPAGDKYYYAGEGNRVTKATWKGTYTITKGTGKFSGIKGNGTWIAYIAAPTQFYTDEEWDIELPQR